MKFTKEKIMGLIFKHRNAILKSRCAGFITKRTIDNILEHEGMKNESRVGK